MKKYSKPLLNSADHEVIERSLGVSAEVRIALEKLLIDGKLQGVAKGVTEQTLTRGKPSLSPKQLHVLNQYVLIKYKLDQYMT